MKVYVVKNYNYDIEILGVYKNEEDAKKVVDEMNNWKYGGDVWYDAYDLLGD